MKAEEFTQHAAANPEAAEVKSLIAKGIVIGENNALERLKANATAAGNRHALAISSTLAGQDAAQITLTIAAIDAEMIASNAAADAKDAEIVRLKALADAGGHAGGVTLRPAGGKASDASSAADPEVQAKSEWANDPNLAQSFVSEKVYVAYRKAQLSGHVRERPAA